jgi:hypothetical protein
MGVLNATEAANLKSRCRLLCERPLQSDGEVDEEKDNND